MAFVREGQIQASAIADISVELFDPEPGTDVRSIWGNIQVRMTDGQIRVRRVNLAQELTGSQVQGLQNLLTNIRTRAMEEILPLPDSPTQPIPPTG